MPQGKQPEVRAQANQTQKHGWASKSSYLDMDMDRSNADEMQDSQANGWKSKAMRMRCKIVKLMGGRVMQDSETNG